MAMLPPDPLYIFKGDMTPVFCLMYKITPYFEFMYAGTQSGKVHIWNLKTHREIDNFQSGKESILSLNTTGDDEVTIITQDKSGMIRFMSKENGAWACLQEISTDYYGFCKCFVYNTILYVPLKESYLESISITSKVILRSFRLCESEKLGEIMAFKIFTLSDQKLAIVAYESGDVCLWNLHDETKISNIKFEHCPMALDFDTRTMRGICGNPSDKAIVFYLDKDLAFNVKKHISLTNPGVASVSIRPDSKVVALGCWDGKLRLYSWKSLVTLAVLDTHSSTVQDVCFSASHRYLLGAASKDTKVSLWDLYN